MVSSRRLNMCKTTKRKVGFIVDCAKDLAFYTAVYGWKPRSAQRESQIKHVVSEFNRMFRREAKKWSCDEELVEMSSGADGFYKSCSKEA
jgi:hypothetical protein